MYRLVVIASCALLVAAVVAVRLLSSSPSHDGSWGSGATPPPDVASALADVLSEPCTSASQALTALRVRFNRLGHSDWRITKDASAEATGCITAIVLPEEREVRLTIALRPEVREALKRLANEMLDKCLTRQQALELVTATLQAAGERGYELRTDGPRTGPNDREADLAQHVANGCYVYGGVGFKPDGTRVYMIGGTLE